jgi:hypothetical protein
MCIGWNKLVDGEIQSRGCNYIIFDQNSHVPTLLQMAIMIDNGGWLKKEHPVTPCVIEIMLGFRRVMRYI